MATIYKMLLFLKRRPGMTTEAFRDYYETRHRLIGEAYPDGVVRYVRRYLEAPPEATDELPYDVLTETWFDDRQIFDAVVASIETGNLPQVVIEDEERLFDRAKTRVATVVEVESAIARAAV